MSPTETDSGPESGVGDQVLFRPGSAEDLPAVAEVFLAARAAAQPAMPPLVHTPGEVRAFFSSLDLTPGEREIWVAESDGAAVGFAEVKRDWLDDLYVHPAHAGAGIGSALLDLVKQSRPDGFCLWVFQSNGPARRFYRRHGLIELELTDGTANEEQSPDIRMAWPGTDPVAFLRGLVDEVDTELGDLLARRVALTAAIQVAKPDRRRDPERERDIVRRVAAAVPALEEAAVARIVDCIVSESLAHRGHSPSSVSVRPGNVSITVP